MGRLLATLAAMMAQAGLLLLLMTWNVAGSPNLPEITSIVTANNEFGSALLQGLPEGRNHLLAPWSLSSAFAMLYLGAKGRTAAEMEQVIFKNRVKSQSLHTGYQELDQLLETNYKNLLFSCVNSILVQTGLEISANYLHNLRQIYHATLYDVDFARGDSQRILKFVNAWTELQTHGQFTSILDKPPGRDTRLVLLNSIYFRGIWQTQFDPRNTTILSFYNNGENVPYPAPFMTTTSNFSAGYDEVTGTRMVELPYTGGSASMILLMPQKASDIMSLPYHLDRLLKNLEPQILKLSILKFSMKKSYRPKGELNRMGMIRVFSPNDAELNGITEAGGLYLSDVVHQVSVDITEEGTEAAAATVLDITSRTSPPSLIFDRPFLFLIRDLKTKLILFMGTIMHV